MICICIGRMQTRLQIQAVMHYNLKRYSGILPAQNYYGPLKWAMGPCPIQIHVKFRILMGLFKIWWARWKFWWAQESLILTWDQNKYWIWIAYIGGPAKNKFKLSLTLMVFTQNRSGPSQKYPWILTWDGYFCFILKICFVTNFFYDTVL